MSSTSIPNFFGRAYRISVDTTSGEHLTFAASAWEPEALHIQFEAEQTALAAYWFAEVVIWNLNEQTQQLVIEQGNEVTICAGYQANFSEDGNQNVVWKGRVFQPIWERENVTDFKLTLRCLVGLFEDQSAWVNLTIPAGQTQLDAVNEVASAAGIDIEDVDEDTLSQKTYARARAVTGRASKFFAQVASDNQMQFWLSPIGVNIKSLAPEDGADPDVVYGPPFPPNVTIHPTYGAIPYTPTLIGTPELTEQGCSWKVLMDSTVKLGMLAKLDMSVVRQLPIYPGAKPSAALLNQDRKFVISAIRHIGDNRGNDWYTEITGVTPQWASLYAGALAIQQ